MKEKILNKLNDYYPNDTEYNKDLANELFLLYSVVGQSEQLSERLCKNNPNFKCNCIDQDRCPNFTPY